MSFIKHFAMNFIICKLRNIKKVKFQYIFLAREILEKYEIFQM